MAFPTVVAVGVYTDTASGTTHNANLPAPGGGILADDLLIAYVGMDGNPGVGWPVGWTEIMDAAASGSTARGACAWKRAAGGESGTIAVTTSASEGGGIRILCVRGAHVSTDPDLTGSATTGSDTAPDPGNLDPAGWDVEDTLWIEAAVWDNGTVDCTAADANYTDLGVTRWDHTAGAGVATATRGLASASEDPGAFTLAATEQWRAWTVAVRPAPGGGATLERAAAVAATALVASAGTFWTTFSRVAAVAATGIVATAGQRDLHRQSAVTATGTVAADGHAIADRAAALAAIGQVATAPQRDLLRQAALAATGLIATSGQIEGQVAEHERSASLTVTSSITTVGHGVLERGAAVSASGVVSSTGQRALLRAVALAAIGSLEAASQRDVHRQLDVSAAGLISTAPELPGWTYALDDIPGWAYGLDDTPGWGYGLDDSPDFTYTLG